MTAGNGLPLPQGFIPTTTKLGVNVLLQRFHLYFYVKTLIQKINKNY
jgi:hypothetical protein